MVRLQEELKARQEIEGGGSKENNNPKKITILNDSLQHHIGLSKKRQLEKVKSLALKARSIIIDEIFDL